MLKNSLTICRIDGRNCFLDISAKAFTLAKEGNSKDGKVVFMFRNYDKSKPVGQRTTGMVDFYLDLEEFAVFCESMKNGRYGRRIQKNIEKAARENKNFAEPGYHKLGGSDKEGKCISRQMQLIKGMKSPFVVQAMQGPGKWDKNHSLIVPQYNFNTATDKVTIPLDAENCIKIGLAGERAINMYDMWVANGVLDERINALSYNKGEKEEQKSPEGAPYNNFNDEEF